MWQWNVFQCIPGEIFLTDDERDVDTEVGVVIEPRTKNKPNKQWPVDRYQAVADELVASGYTVSQLVPPNQKPLLYGVQRITTGSFRRALGVLSHAQLYIGGEGGLHHGSAALDVPAVVLFGGFIGPETTGYKNHVNLTGGAKACGSPWTCSHCKKAMEDIPIDEVLLWSQAKLQTRKHLLEWGIPHDLEVQSAAERGGTQGVCEPPQEGGDHVLP